MNRNSVRSAARLAAILDALPDALLLADATGRVVNANAAALELFEGESAERLMGKPLSALLPGYGRGIGAQGAGPALLPAGSESAPPAADRTGAATARRRPERLAAQRTDGSVFPAEATATVLPGDDDELTLFVVRDLTGVLDLEAELRRQQRQIELILRAASEGIVGVDDEGRIVLVNPAGARILRHRAGDLGGQDAHELIAHSAADGSPLPADRCLLVDSLRTGVKHRSVDEVLWRSDGTSVTVDMTTAPVYEGEAIIGAVMTFTDNSEVRSAARRARELAEVLEDDLRGPLAGVLAELRELAGFGIGELGPAVRRSLAAATQDLGEVAELVEDITDYQRLVVGDTPYQPEPADLADLVDAAVAAGSADAAALGVDVFGHSAQVAVRVDLDLFPRLLGHLIADLVTASPVGGKVVATAARRGPVARVEIRGPHTGGGPLHLPIARAIAARHGGSVTTHRIAGKGNTHVVEIPVGAAGDAVPARRQSAALGSGSREAGGRGEISPKTAAGTDTEPVPGPVRPALGRRRFFELAEGPQVSGPAPEPEGTGQPADDPSPYRGRRSQPRPTDERTAGLERNGMEPVRAAAKLGGDLRDSINHNHDTNGLTEKTSSAASGRSDPSPVDRVVQADVVEKANGHHTSHGTAVRHSPAVVAEGTARVPGQGGRSAISRALELNGLDVKPSRPLPTSDVWSRPAREAAPRRQPDDSDDMSGGSGAPGVNGRAGLAPTEPASPAANRAVPVPAGTTGETASAGHVTDHGTEQGAESDEATQPRGRRRAGGPTLAGATPSAGTRVQHPGPAAIPDSGPAPDPARGPALDPAPDQPLADEARQSQLDDAASWPERTPGSTAPGAAAASPEPSAPSEPVPDGAAAGPPCHSRVLMWPEPDPSTVELLNGSGYAPSAIRAEGGSPGDLPSELPDGLAAVLAARSAASGPRALAVFVDPIAAPITRRGLRALRGAAIEVGLPILVTAGIGRSDANAPAGPDPALLLQALTPSAVALPRILLVEDRPDLAAAMTAALERQGMQVTRAASESESVSRAADVVPDVVLMDLMQVRRRRSGIVEWLRDRDRLTTTPVVVYTVLGPDSERNGLAAGNQVLYLAERSTGEDVGDRIVDLLSKLAPAGS